MDKHTELELTLEKSERNGVAIQAEIYPKEIGQLQRAVIKKPRFGYTKGGLFKGVNIVVRK